MLDHIPQMPVMLMWTISSNDVQQAKERMDRRRAEVEARYAAEKEALAAELAAIEALERVAAEFAQRHSSDDPATTMAPAAANIEPPLHAATVEPEPAGYAEPAFDSEATETQVEPETISDAAGDSDPAGDTESGPAFDILKPGSRWRFNRAARLLNPEEAPVTPPPSYPSSSS